MYRIIKNISKKCLIQVDKYSMNFSIMIKMMMLLDSLEMQLLIDII